MPKKVSATQLATALRFRSKTDPHPKIVIPPITSADEYEVAREYLAALPQGIEQGWAGIEHRADVEAVIKAWEAGL